jgi:hypothetical protein
MDCATIRSDVIGDFQELYGAVLVEGDDMAALPSNRLRKRRGCRRARPAVAPILRDAADGATLPTVDGRDQSNATHEAAFRIIEIVEAVGEMPLVLTNGGATKSSHAGALAEREAAKRLRRCLHQRVR